MKLILRFSLLTACLLTLLSPKTRAQAPAGFKPGYIITADNNRQEGFIKDNFRSKANIVFQSTDGKKKTYVANDIRETGIDGTVYITYGTDFFKLLSTGTKASLYQKASDASGQVIYNGSEAVGISTGTEGAIRDHFLKVGTDNNLKWITKKNFQQVLSSSCSDCPALVDNVKTNKIGYDEIEKAVQQYNDCK
jgi:hypothetical protein